MKFSFAAALGPLLASAALGAAAGGVQKQSAALRGFVDVNLAEDESLRVARNEMMSGHQVQHEQSHRTEDAASAEIQEEVETMIERLKTIHDAKLAEEFEHELSGIEQALAHETKDQYLVQEINAAHAALCAGQGFAPDEEDECESFMRAACDEDHPNADAHVTVDNCVTYFRREDVNFHLEQASAAVASNATANAAPAGAPGPAPGPAPALFGGKGVRPLPEQGLAGKTVQHVDQETMIEDWGAEFGPKAGHGSFDSVCAKFPDNEWCQLHGYGGPVALKEEPKQAGAHQFCATALIAVVAAQFA